MVTPTPSRNLRNYMQLIGKAAISQDGLADYLADAEAQSAPFEAYAEDVEIVEPACLPQGGIHKGRQAWQTMHHGIQELWNQKLVVRHIWDQPEDDTIVLHAVMEWAAKATGKTATVPFVGILEFRDGLIVRVEIFHQDPQLILETLEPQGGRP